MTVSHEEREGLRERIEDVGRRIRAAAQRAHRTDEVKLVAITKTHSATTVKAAAALGLRDFGENRVQEAQQKIIEVGSREAHWHLVGHLQANKAKRAMQIFDVIHSLDSIELAQRLARFCREEERKELSVLIQVDLAGEATKSGVEGSKVEELAVAVNELKELKLIGLMVLPPYFADPELTRPFFVKLRALRDELHTKNLFGDSRGELSMGMSHDFEVAVEEGATMVRVGTALFGEREAKQ